MTDQAPPVFGCELAAEVSLPSHTPVDPLLVSRPNLVDPGLLTARVDGDQMSRTRRTTRMTGAVAPAGAAAGGAADRVPPQRQPAAGLVPTWMTQAPHGEADVLRTGGKPW
jgi:hypothetical protein